MNEKPAVILTGASQGIGKYLTEHLIAQGYHVIGCSRTEVDDSGVDGFSYYAMDVTQEKSVIQFTRWVQKNFKNVYGLINNAGTASMNAALMTPLGSMEHVMSVNYVGTFLMCREIAKLMVRQRFGRIINVGTVAVPLKLEGESAYVASKGAVIAYTQVLAKELAPYGVTCNVVSPGPVMTKLLHNVQEEKIQSLVEKLAVKRMTKMEDIANVVDFYLRKESDMITGQILSLGGV